MKTNKALLTLLFTVLVAVPLSRFFYSVDGVQSSPAPKVETIILKDSNTLSLNGEVSGENVSAIMNKAKVLAAKKKFHLIKDKSPIYLFLYTPGGSVQSGYELDEMLKGLGRPVHTIVAIAASMGFQLAQMLGDRLILDSGILMSHHGTGGSDGEMGGLRPNQSDNRKRIWEQRLLEMDQRTVQRSKGKQTLKSYQTQYDHELWMTGREAVKAGYADKVVQVRCDESLSGVTTKSIDFMGLVKIDFDIDNCPLNSTPSNVRVHVDTNKGNMILADFKKYNGGYGSACLTLAATNGNVVCAVDTSLTPEKINAFIKGFMDVSTDLQNHVVPMTF